MIRGSTALIAHIGYPTDTFKSPLIYNPYFEQAGIDAVVVPMACQPAHYADLLRSIFRLANIRGALITMPHKVTTVGLLDDTSPAVQVAGACNAVRLGADGRLQGDLFDGEGFVRGVRRMGVRLDGARALIVGCGGVGSAIAASLAAAGVEAISLFDVRAGIADALAGRLARFYPALRLATGSNDAAAHDLVVNATPLGMNPGDPLPIDVTRLASDALVGEVVLRDGYTPFLEAAKARGCRLLVGLDMLFEQIPAYLSYFGYPPASPDALRAVARLEG